MCVGTIQLCLVNSRVSFRLLHLKSAFSLNFWRLCSSPSLSTVCPTNQQAQCHHTYTLFSFLTSPLGSKGRMGAKNQVKETPERGEGTESNSRRDFCHDHRSSAARTRARAASFLNQLEKLSPPSTLLVEYQSSLLMG